MAAIDNYMLFAYFSLLAFIFLFFNPGIAIWTILLISAVVWFFLEYNANGKMFNFSIKIGLFLLVFDFIIENSGALMWLWKTEKSALFVGHVPIEVMFLCLVGGAAWALHLPKRFNLIYSLTDVLLFSLFGMVGELALIQNGLMSYGQSWNPSYAYLGYLATWIILHTLYYAFTSEKEREVSV